MQIFARARAAWAGWRAAEPVEPQAAPTAQQPTHTTSTPSDDDGAASVDSLDTVESSSADSSVVDCEGPRESEAPSDTTMASPDPAEDLSPFMLSRQARAVREASLKGMVWLGQAIAANDPKEAMMVLSVAPYLLNEPLSNGETPLQMAVSQGHAKLVALLLQCKHIDPNKPGAEGWTPLCLAAHKNEIAIAAKLIQHDRIQLNGTLPNKSSALYIAAAHDHRAIAQQLLRAGADIHQAKRGGFTPLHVAAHAGHVGMVRWLLQQPALWRHGSDGAGQRGDVTTDPAEVLNPRASNGQTPLILAVNQGRLGVVRLLLEQEGIDPNLLNAGGHGALHHAAAGGRTEVMAALLEHPDTEVDFHSDTGLPALFFALVNNKLEAAALLLNRGANIHWRARDDSHLLDALVHAHDSTAQWLLKRPELLHQNGKPVSLKAVLNQSSNHGVTVLQQTAMMGNTTLVQRLLSHGADPNRENDGGWTPLSRAVEEGHLDTAQRLLPLRQAGIDEPLATGRTLLCVAIGSGKLAIAAWLVIQGASILQANKDGSTPWHIACGHGMTAARWLLNEARRQLGVQANGFLNGRDAHGATALQRAAGANARDLVRFLLKQTHIDVKTADHEGWAPLHLAARNGARDTLLELLAHPGIDLFQKGPEGKTFLHCVAMCASPQPLLEAVSAHLSTAQFQTLKGTRDDFLCFPVSTAAEHGASQAVLNILRPAAAASPALQTRTTFQRGWILEGYGWHSRSAWADLGTKAGFQMHAIGDGDGGEALTFQKLQQLTFQPGDFVVVHAHSNWDADLKRVEVGLSEDAGIPLVEIARVLFERGVLKALFLGCEVNMAMTGLRNRFARDPMLWRPQKGATALEDLDYTLVGRKGPVASDLDVVAATLWLEDCAARRPQALAADSALLNRSVPPARTLRWNASTGTPAIVRRSRLHADRLGHLSPAEADRAKGELLHLSACDGRVQDARVLLERHQVDPNVRSLNGFTPLIYASSFGHTEMVAHLLQHNADVHLVDIGGRSALWHACSDGYAQAVELLLAAGADPHVDDARGVSAWGAARMKGHTAVLKLLPPPPTATATQRPSPP